MMRRRLLSAAAALALALTGCSGEPAPGPDPTTASPTATAPTMPELAGDDSPAGAEAFVRHYIDVLNHAALTGDTAQLRELSSDDCSGCASYIELYETTYENGGHFEGGEWTVESAEVDYSPDATEQYVTLETKMGEGHFNGGANDDSFDTEPSQDTVSFALTHDESWSITQFGLGTPK